MSDGPIPVVSLLIIDDNLGSLKMLSSALAQPGLDILTASDPEDGLDIACSRHPQIVLTDLVMLNLSGLDVLERIMWRSRSRPWPNARRISRYSNATSSPGSLLNMEKRYAA